MLNVEQVTLRMHHITGTRANAISYNRTTPYIYTAITEVGNQYDYMHMFIPGSQGNVGTFGVYETITHCRLGVSEQALGGITLGFGVVVEDKPSEHSSTCIHACSSWWSTVHSVVKATTYNILVSRPLKCQFTMWAGGYLLCIFLY